MHNAPVSAPPNTFPLETTRRIIRIQVLTLVWMSVEAVVSLGAAWFAHSPALLGFGGDSAVELLSATVESVPDICSTCQVATADKSTKRDRVIYFVRKSLGTLRCRGAYWSLLPGACWQLTNAL